MDNKSTNIKERVLQIAEIKGISKEKFIESIGMTYGNFKGKSKNTPLNSNAIEDILTSNRDIDPEWLLTGKGEMLRSDNSNLVAKPIPSLRKTIDPLYELQRIPVYNLDATMGLVPTLNDNGIDEDKIIDYIEIGALPECDGATTATGDSMYPLLKAGDLVAYKSITVHRDNIFFGEIYLLAILLDESTTMKTVKFVQHSDLGEDYIKIVSHNQHHPPKDIHLKKIAAMGLVRASIRIHN